MMNVNEKADIHFEFEELVKKNIILSKFISVYEDKMKSSIFQRFDFYANLINYFAYLFHISDSRLLNDLSFATYFYYKGISEIDDVFDNKKQPKNIYLLNYFTSVTFINEALFRFRSIFSGDNNFWEDIENLKKEFYEAQLLELSLKSENIEYTKTVYEELILKKNILVLSPIFALAYLADDFSLFPIIKDSILLFHQGMQIFDDVFDFKLDVENNHLTYQHILVKKFMQKNNLLIKDNPEQLYKYFHFSGTSLNSLKDAKQKIHESLILVNDLSVEGYKKELISRENKLTETIIFFENRLNK